MSKILIIGGAGYIGSHLVHKLIALGHSLYVIDSLANSTRQSLPETIPLFVFDYSQMTIAKEILADNLIECVIHCGAWTDARESIQEPTKHFVNNFVGTILFAEAMKQCHIKQMIYLSTAAVYGEISTGLAEESDLPNPINPNGMSHLGAEHFLSSMVHIERWSVAIFRLANVVGSSNAYLHPRYPSKTLFSSLKEAIDGQQEPVKIFTCENGFTFDGTPIRDYVHIEDVAEAITSIVSHMPVMGTREVYNLASGRGNSVREVIHCFEKVSGIKISTVESPKNPHEITRSVLQIRKAQRELRWEQRFRTLEDIVKDICKTPRSFPTL